jgi:membrane protease YdiL (CAAX protease family)
MKITFALFKQSMKTLLVWLVILLIVAFVGKNPGSVFNVMELVRAMAVVVLSLLIYLGARWLFEPSPFLSTSLRFNARAISQGFLLGAALAIPLVLLQLIGMFNTHFPQPESIDLVDTILRALTLAIVAGVTEELMFRGVLLHALEKNLGTWWAWLLQALVFGLLHYARPDVVLVDLIPLVFMGLLFGAAYILTRNLWFTIVMHTIYDWIVLSYPGTIEAMAKPGVDYEPIEYFILAIFCVVMLALALPMLKRARERGHILLPQWKLVASVPAGVAINEIG